MKRNVTRHHSWTQKYHISSSCCKVIQDLCARQTADELTSKFNNASALLHTPSLITLHALKSTVSTSRFLPTVHNPVPNKMSFVLGGIYSTYRILIFFQNSHYVPKRGFTDGKCTLWPNMGILKEIKILWGQ